MSTGFSGGKKTNRNVQSLNIDQILILFFREPERRTPYELTTERVYYENVRTPGIYAEDPRREYPGRSRDRYTELDPYQGEPYDPRYHEDPREYRDYRDPFEDIRKYSYIQRERERERERFEADRGRWSPSHPRRPLTPSASPSPSDRVSRDTERRVYRHSSERSGSCSSLSPAPAPFEKSEKSPVDYKSEELERETELAERASGTEYKKRGKRKEKADREKGEKAKQRRGKVQSPSVPISEEDKEASLDLGSGKVKVSDVESQERQKHKGDKEPSPTDHVTRLESQKGERLDPCKSESLDREGKGKIKKPLKSDSGSDGKDSLVDSVKLEARKRRFADPGGKAIRQKRGRLEEDPSSGISQPAEFTTSAVFAKETDIDVKAEKEAQKREHSKSRISSHYSHREELDGAMRGTSRGSSLRQGEVPEVDVLDSNSHPGPSMSMSRRFTTDGTSEKDNKVRDEHLENIDLSQSCRKQMEQNRRLRQQLKPQDKPEKTETPQGVDAEDLEYRSLVHEVGKPPQDVTDNSPPSKTKKQESFEMEMSAKRERIYRTVRQKSEDPEWNNINSQRFQHAPQQRDEEYADPRAQMTVREVKEALKPVDNAPTDHELGSKHASQTSKMSTSLQDDQHWESRLKQDLLPDFSRSTDKRQLNRKYLDFGLWPDLEPGEVRSDSEEDRENKPNSPAPSTSVSFSERPRPDRLSESKLTPSLERNKFRSFADDQTITPDTKALLERAKSLSSSREDNWSFLDYDSHFPSFRSRKDTEKVESAPRPTPSWYMKKKKIRSESDDKTDDRKEDPKPEEQERRELFASRFLHSSIFEQDSRRLQHLERKHEDPEHGVGYLYSRQGPVEGQPDPEPVVLFHSRFLELTRVQQQKNKELRHQDSKQEESTYAIKVSKTQLEEQAPLHRNATEPRIQQAEIKSFSPVQVLQTSPVLVLQTSPVQAPQISPPVLAVEESLPTVEAEGVVTPTWTFLDSSMKEKDKEQPTAQPLQPLLEQPSESNSSECQELLIAAEEMALNAEDSERAQDTNKVVADQLQRNETPTNNVQPEAEPPVKFPESPSPLSHIPAEQQEKEPEPPVAPEAESNNADDQKCANYPVEEAVSPPPKSRNKRAKTSPTTPVTVTLPATPDKQSTRKSERIDKEKLKRSPRGEAFKTTPDSKSLSKSPVHSIEMETGTEQSPQSVRARRRNVRSVYATPIEDETALPPGKDAESPRSARKRGVDRDVGSDAEAVAAQQTSRRGRPPKNRRQAEDAPAGKVERSKSTESKELDGSETSSEGVPKVGKGKFSPHAQKAVSPGNASASGFGKKGDKVEKISESPKLVTEETPPVLKDLRIRLDVTEVKSMLQTSEEEPGTEESPKNGSPGVSSNDEGLEATFENDANSERETLPIATKAIEPHVASLAQELELEQAVENIAKLTDNTTSLQFKSNLTKTLRPITEEPERDLEEKPANQSSETELAAAIDSITSENTEQIISSAVESDPAVQTLGPSSKVSETCVRKAAVQEETVTIPRKGYKGRTKTTKKGKGQKGAGSKKEPIKDIVLDAETIHVKSPESVPAELPAAMEKSPASTAVVITASSKQGVSLPAPNADISNEPELPLKTEKDIPKSSPAISRSPTSSKYQPYSYNNTSPSLSPTRTCLKNLSSYPSKLSASLTERFNQPKEAGVLSPPLTSVAPMESPTLPSDTPAHDANSLRKILTKPRTVPVLETGATSGNMHTHPLRESDVTPVVVARKSAPQDNRQPPVSAQPVVRQPASIPSPETKQIFSEKSVISVIASTPTSVISRVCNPPDSEEKPNAQIGNPFLDKQPPKQIYQPSLEESSTYHGPAVGEEGGNAGRYVLESTSLSTGSSTGLRVQTSEGVVVLSHSGQKMEGPLRISAKISQIPPASAVDIESQQLVSMPQIKQELYSASQPPSSKYPLPLDHGHSMKPQPNASTIKQESTLDMLESAYAPVQSGVVKMLQQTPGPSQVMSYHPTEYSMAMKHPKKGDAPESLNLEKPTWTISPARSPHLPSTPGNHVGFITSTQTDRTQSLIQPKQEPRSPRKSGHPHSPFAKVSSPIGSSSPKGVSMVLPSGLPPLSQYVSTVHHSEQSVIMPPHNTHGSIGRMSPHRVSAIGHLTQGEVRVNTPPLSMMNYGIHSESLASSWAPGQQRPTSPQAVGNREMVLKVNPANARPPAAQLKPDSIPAEYRGALDRFNRDIRVLMHHQQSDRSAAELHQGHAPENIPRSSTPTSMAASHSPRPHLLAKGVSEKDSSKASELKRAQSPSSKEGMMAIRSAMHTMASPQRVQLIPAGTAASFDEYSTMYTNLRPAHTQFAENSPMGINQSAHSIPPSQVSLRMHRFKTFIHFKSYANKASVLNQGCTRVRVKSGASRV